MVIDNNILVKAGDVYFLKKVTIPGSVKTIGTAAFSECRSLTTVCLSEGIEEILCGAFELCTKLKNINIPSTIQYMGDYAFKDCISLTKIDLSKMRINDNWKMNTPPEEMMLGECEIIAMTSPNKCIRKTPLLRGSLGKGIFEGCRLLKEVKLYPQLKYIPKKGFKNCWNLETIELPDSIRYIYKSAFAGCSSLEEIKIPDKVSYIGKKAFSDCGLFDIDIPDSVRTLHKDTFSDCCNLKTVIIGNKTKKISKNALPKETTIKTRRVKGAQDLKLKKNSLYGEWGCCDDKEDSVD